MSEPLPPAIVLTAGLGTRLAPLTYARAKTAVPIAGTPLILRVLAWLAREGVSDVVLNLHHKPETITRVVGYGEAAGVSVRYSWEPTLLGSAGGPRHALPLLGSRFFIVNGDTLTDIPLQALRSSHVQTDALVTLALTRYLAPKRYGGVIVDDNGWIQGFTPPGHGTAHHFVGVQLVEASVFADLPEGKPAATIGGTYDALIARRPHTIHAHAVTASFHDIGTPRDYLTTSLAIAEQEGLGALPVGEGSTIHPTASVLRTAVWDHVEVAEECHVIDCVLADGVRLPRRCRLERQVVVTESGRARTAFQQRMGDLLVAPLSPPVSASNKPVG